MALCCIGGVCIPYSALLPLLWYALQWFVRVVGPYVLPLSWQQNLSNFLGKTTSVPKTVSCNGTCTSSDSLAKNHSSSEFLRNHANEDGLIKLESDDDWQSFVQQRSTDQKAILKFTAPWCAPCQQIHPLFVELVKASKMDSLHAKSLRFCEVNADECEELTSFCKIAMLPTFIVISFKRDKRIAHNLQYLEVARYAGSSDLKLKAFFKEHVQAT